MNANDMLDIIGEVKGSYVMEAQSYREGGTGSRHRSPMKIILIAAIISILLAGCTYAVLKLQDLKMGEYIYESPLSQNMETVELNILSLQGFQGSVNYNAAKEWLDFQQTYQHELGARPLTEEEQKRYSSYACYDRTMADKLEEIAAKYGMKLHGEWFHEIENEEIYDLLGIGGILRPEVQTENFYGHCTLFQDGSFRQEGGFTPIDCPWPHSISYFYQYTRKDVLDDVVKSTEDLGHFDQWLYTTEDGSEVLLALGPNYAMIFADLEEAFVHLSISNDDYPAPFSMEKSELEAVTELFDFTIQPQPLDDAKLNTARQLRDVAIQARMAEEPGIVDSYGAYAQYYLSSRGLNNENEFKMEYAVRDMNDDGIEELVILGNKEVWDIVTMVDGKTNLFGGNGRPWVWLEGDLFMDCFNYADYGGGNLPADDVVIIRRFDGLKKIDVRRFQHVDGQQWKELDPFTDIPIADLTDEEFQRIMDSYKPIDLNTLNLKPLHSLAEG